MTEPLGLVAAGLPLEGVDPAAWLSNNGDANKKKKNIDKKDQTVLLLIILILGATYTSVKRFIQRWYYLQTTGIDFCELNPLWLSRVCNLFSHESEIHLTLLTISLVQ